MMPPEFRTKLLLPIGCRHVPFAEVMADFQRPILEALDAGFVALAKGQKPEIGRFWCELIKGSGKDTMLSVQVLWLAAYSPRPLTCQVGAADQEQAAELRKAAGDILHCNPWLEERGVEIQQWAITNRRKLFTCDILAADVAGSHGARPDLLILNELSHIEKETFAHNLADNASKKPDGIFVVLTNAGFTPSWQWDWRELARTSPRWFFAAHKEPAPWLDPQEIEEARKRNPPQRFARLWEGQWVRGMGDALSAADIEASVTLTGPLLPGLLLTEAHADYAFYLGCDIGVSRDHSAIAITGRHRTTGRLRLAYIRSWVPPQGGKVNLEDVVQACLNAHEIYAPRKMLVDPHQATLLVQMLERQGVNIEEVPFTSASLTEMATVVLERFNTRSVEIFKDEGLLNDLHAMKLIDRPVGYRLEFPRSTAGHGDKATAFILSLLAAERCPQGGFSARDAAFIEEVSTDCTASERRMMMTTICRRR